MRSERGPSGGYRLNHPPEDITLGKIVRIIQGPLAPISCATRHEPEPCAMEIGCSLRETWDAGARRDIAILDAPRSPTSPSAPAGSWTAITLSTTRPG